ncbi:MAG: hypothetical protein ACF8R7_03985 [Phycisphaerales bacterium JB039]
MRRHEIPDRLQPLLALGDPREDPRGPAERPELWMDYSTLGIGPADAEALIALATDRRQYMLDLPACFGPLHAWRALGQLRCESAIRPLLERLDYAAQIHDDWGLEEIPEALAMIGPAALAQLALFVPDQRRGLFARTAAAYAMRRIAASFSEYRSTVISKLAEQLKLSRYNDETLNGLIISDLLELRAVEASDAIERAYLAGDVDESVCGDLDEVLAELKPPAEAAQAPADASV